MGYDNNANSLTTKLHQKTAPHRLYVTPNGSFLRLTAAEYSLIGNRGVLHDDHGAIIAQFASKAWLACSPSRRPNQPKRPVAAPGRYTLLFFLDEATALAAGHRPCWTCRRPDFHRFLGAWARGNLLGGESASVATVDDRLQRQRITARDRKVTFKAAIDQLPNGCIVAMGDAEYLILGPHLYRWSPMGYTEQIARPSRLKVSVLTPRSTVAALVAGYVPEVHASAVTR